MNSYSDAATQPKRRPCGCCRKRCMSFGQRQPPCSIRSTNGSGQPLIQLCSRPSGSGSPGYWETPRECGHAIRWPASRSRRSRSCRAYATSPLFSALDRDGIAFAEQFVIDVSGTSQESLDALRGHLGADRLRDFATSVYLVEFTQRLQQVAAGFAAVDARPVQRRQIRAAPGLAARAARVISGRGRPFHCPRPGHHRTGPATVRSNAQLPDLPDTPDWPMPRPQASTAR